MQDYGAYIHDVEFADITEEYKVYLEDTRTAIMDKRAIKFWANYLKESENSEYIDPFTCRPPSVDAIFSAQSGIAFLWYWQNIRSGRLRSFGS